jgi:hypothetical protein
MIIYKKILWRGRDIGWVGIYSYLMGSGGEERGRRGVD